MLSIRGAGGLKSGASGASAIEDPDTLLSRQRAFIKEVICEGPIVGLQPMDRPMRGVFLDGTPIENVGGRVLTDVTLVYNSKTMVSASGNFTTADIGKVVTGEGIPQLPQNQYSTLIVSIDSPTQVQLNNFATVAGTNVLVSIAGALNFTNFDFYLLNGTQDQGYIPGFNASEAVVSVGLKLLHATPWVQTISNSLLDAITVTIRFPRFESQDITNGNIHGTTLNLTIELQSNGGGFVQKINDTITGKASSAYLREYKIDLAGLPAPWDVRVTRVTADTTTQALQNDTYVDTYSTIIYGKLRHPNSAHIGLSIDAEQFGSIPTRAYHIRGLIIQVPTNYDPVARTYATTGAGTTNGTWDGTFKLAWTNNPAWCWYDLATNARYGLGNYLDAASVDSYALYTIAQFCDVFVPTGLSARILSVSGLTLSAVITVNTLTRSSGSFITDGWLVGDEINITGFVNAANNGRAVILNVSAGTLYLDQKTLVAESAVAGITLAVKAPTEPRFTCNLYIQAQEDAMKVLTDLASNFRAFLYYAQGVLTPSQDKPGVASAYALFSPSNIINGQFTYSGTGNRSRHTVAQVSWNDLTNQGKLTPEYVEDSAAVNLYGVNALVVTAFGCTSQSQARRFGLWALAAERLLTETVTFETGAEGFQVKPGSLIQIQDPFKAGKTLSGRMVSATSTVITTDRPVILEVGRTYWISFFNPADGTALTVPVLNAAGTTSTITIAALANYNSATTYNLGDQITYLGLNYQSLVASNLNHTPSLSPTQWAACSPAAGTIWQLASDILSPALFRCIDMKPKDNATCVISALEYDANMYTDLENFSLDAAVTSALPLANVVAAPGEIAVFEVPAVTPDGVQRSLNVSWAASPDAYLRYYKVDYRYQNGNWVNAGNPLTNDIIIPMVGTGQYDLRVYAINQIGGISSPSLDTIYVSEGNPLTQMQVTGLELSGQGNGVIFSGRDAQFDFRINSPGSFIDIGNDLTGISGTRYDPYFQAWECTVWNGTVSIWRELVTQPHFDFTQAKNSEGVNNVAGYPTIKLPPLRSFRLEVRVIDIFNNLSDPETLTVSNPSPLALTNIVAKPGTTSVDLQCDRPLDNDFKGIRWWRSTDPAFTIDDTTIPVYDGPDTKVTIPQDQASTYYYRGAGYDAFGTVVAQLNISGNITATTGTLTPTLPAPAVDPGSNTFTTTFNVTLTIDPTQTARYTLDGTDVTVNSLQWPGSVGAYTTLAITGSCTLKVRGYLPDGVTPTKQTSVTYMLVGSSPGTPSCGHVNVGWSGTPNIGVTRTATLSCSTTGAVIHISKNGGAYTTYSSPVSMLSGDYATAYATASGFTQGANTDFDNINNLI